MALNGTTFDANCMRGCLYDCACIFLCFFSQHVSLALTVGFAEVLQKYQQSIKNYDTFKMYPYHDTFDKCIKCQYHGHG